jgi:hypothetical protein
VTTTVGTPLGVTASAYRAASIPTLPAITGLAGHWDAADASKFTYGTGTQVATWIDKSTNGFTVSKTPAADVTRTGTINGVACVTATSYLERLNVPVRALLDPTTFMDCMSFAVMELSSNYGSYMAQVGSGYRCSADIRGGVANYFDIAAARLEGDIGVTTSTPTLLTLYRSGAIMKLRKNGTEMLTRSNAAGGGATTETGSLRICGMATGGAAFQGKLGEVVHVARYNATDLATVEAYMKLKWGIP